MNTKINLADLSYVLEQELHSIEENNATYQAAIATYEHTLHYVKYVCQWQGVGVERVYGNYCTGSSY